MNNIIDCKGLNCPLPVVNTKKYFEVLEEGTATTIVDNEVAKKNVIKLAEKIGCKYKVEEKEGLFYIEINKIKKEIVGESVEVSQKLAVVVGKDELGDGEQELGKILIKSYFFALSESEIIPDDLIFLNSGVKLTIEGAATVDSINKLQERGTKIQVCGTCLDYYNIKDKLQVGEISNMYSIVETMNSSHKIINL